MDLSYLLVAQMSRSGDFVVTDRQADRRTKPITLSLVHVAGAPALPIASVKFVYNQIC